MVATPRGRKPVLKTLLSSACELNCYYCPFRAGRDRMRRVTFTPDELAGAFDQLQQARLADGIMLSSGLIGGGVRTQDKILDTAAILRRKLGYRGYIHLKIMPGAERDQVYQAMALADRVSVNLEGPNQSRLSALAPRKVFETDLLERLKWASHLIDEYRATAGGGKAPSLVTQFVVGAVGDTDLELLTASDYLYRRLGLKRAYYSSFHPVEGTPFEGLAPSADLRELRLYQASFLLRDYGWDVEETPFLSDGNLRLDIDPKRAYAEMTLRQAPVDLAKAARADLLRVPGIGPRGASAILRARTLGSIRDLADLRRIGVRMPEQSAPYILLDGRRPPQQLPLF